MVPRIQPRKPGAKCGLSENNATGFEMLEKEFVDQGVMTVSSLRYFFPICAESDHGVSISRTINLQLAEAMLGCRVRKQVKKVLSTYPGFS